MQPSQDKKSLRVWGLTRRLAIPLAASQTQSALIMRSCIEHFVWADIHCVHCYLPHAEKMEINTWPLMEYLFTKQPHITVVSNRINFETHEIMCSVMNAQTGLVRNCFGIEEPDRQAKIIDPKKIDLMIVPLLACDVQGNRLGYGKGYYDRLLAKCRPDLLRIGVDYFAPLEALIPKDAHDVPLNGLIFDEGIFTLTSQAIIHSIV